MRTTMHDVYEQELERAHRQAVDAERRAEELQREVTRARGWSRKLAHVLVGRETLTETDRQRLIDDLHADVQAERERADEWERRARLAEGQVLVLRQGGAA